jgi:hypothetical protein
VICFAGFADLIWWIAIETYGKMATQVSASSPSQLLGRALLGLSLCLLVHAGFSSVHFRRLVAERYGGEAAGAALPADVFLELGGALAAAFAAVLLFAEALQPVFEAGDPLESLHRLFAPRRDFAPIPVATPAQLAAISAEDMERVKRLADEFANEALLIEAETRERARARARARARLADEGAAAGAPRARKPAVTQDTATRRKTEEAEDDEGEEVVEEEEEEDEVGEVEDVRGRAAGAKAR